MKRNMTVALAALALLAPIAARAQAGPTARRVGAAAAEVAPVFPERVRRVRPDTPDGSYPLRENASALRRPLPALGSLCEDCISAINGRSVANVIFTPGTDNTAAMYTIVGNGFGEVSGAVFLTGPFNTRPELRVESWSNRQIKAYFPRGLRGEPDRQGVGLTIRLADGRLISTPLTASFHAAREEQVIDFADIPRKALRPQSNSSLWMTLTNGGLSFTGIDSGDSVKTGYTDRIVVDFLNSGFVATDFSVGFCRQDIGSSSSSGEPGGRYLYGRYDARWDGDDIVIERAMWQDHRSPFLAIAARDTFESCFRDLKITVQGPAGLKPIR